MPQEPPPFKDHEIPETEFVQLSLVIPLPRLNRSESTIVSQVLAALQNRNSALFKGLVELGAIPRKGWTGDPRLGRSAHYVVQHLRRKEQREAAYFALNNPQQP